MEHKFPLESFHQANRTTFSDVPFIPKNFQWNEPKSRVPFTSPEFPEYFGKWKAPEVSLCQGSLSHILQPSIKNNLTQLFPTKHGQFQYNDSKSQFHFRSTLTQK